MQKDKYASWETAHGYTGTPNKDANPRISPERSIHTAFGFEVSGLGKPRRLFTRRQWFMLGRVVNVFDHEAEKIFETKTGRAMHLFNASQTRAKEDGEL